jgi:hypothetical protein
VSIGGSTEHQLEVTIAAKEVAVAPTNVAYGHTPIRPDGGETDAGAPDYRRAPSEVSCR